MLEIMKRLNRKSMKSELIEVNRLKLNSLVKINVIGITLGFLPIGICIGLYAMITGSDNVTINNEPVYGIKAFITATLLSIFVGLVFSFFGSFISWIGLNIYSRFTNMRLRFYPKKSSF